MHTISFPGLGIKEFQVNEVAIPNVFGRDIMWYGIIITFGIVCALAYVLYRAKRNENIKTDHVLDYAIYVVVFGVIGARLYYVFSKFDSFKADTIKETLYNIIAVWNGGLAIYGGIIAGGLTLAIVSWIKKIKVGKAFDMVAPAVMLGQLIGRWGNFFNGEAYGWSENVAKLPWRMQLEGAYRTVMVNGTPQNVPVDFVHPTFLYESLWNLLGFLLINLHYKRKKFDGQVFFMYITWYGFGRMLIEGLRTDSLYAGQFRISQVIAFVCFFFGSVVLVAMHIVCRLRQKDNALLAATASGGAEASSETGITAKTATEETSEIAAVPSTETIAKPITERNAEDSQNTSESPCETENND